MPFRHRANAPVALISITVMLGMIMAIVDATIVNVALNTIGGNLGASIDEVAWVTTGYILASVVVMPLNGWLTAFLGRKRFYATSLAIFTIASLLCGTARSIWVLVFYRVLQGIGGGALQPTAQAILFETYPAEKRGQAMALFGLGAMVGPAIGPLLGGYLIDNATWPIIFFINIPIGIIAFVMTLMFIPNPSFIERIKTGVDWVGLGLLTAGLASLQYVLERGQHDDWFNSSTIWILSTIAIGSLVAFVWRMLKSNAPLVNLMVFRLRQFWIGNVVGVVLGFGLFGSMLILPLFLQSALNFTAMDTGMALLPGALASAVGMVIIGRFGAKFDPRILIATGMILFGASTWAMGDLNQFAGYWDFFWPRVIQGFSLGFIFVPLTTVTLGAVPNPELANATGIMSLVRQIGGSFGIAILTTLLSRQMTVTYEALANGVTRTHGVPIPVLAQIVAVNAQVISYDYLFRLTGLIFFICVPLVYFLRAAKRPGNAGAAAPALVME
ncbi:MAG: DHA2 family efflux MFS transporter permease subunit [Candidatus Eremiobacteraeota bacterium]|nr:DHA2 family efflux MFS transporter permease subunit [Candidatus Eremiobacteraeota bacterium]